VKGDKMTTLREINLWAGVQIIWRGKKVFLIAAIQEEDGSYTLHYEDKKGLVITFDISEKELKNVKVAA
jgi:hypothetical protein